MKHISLKQFISALRILSATAILFIASLSLLSFSVSRQFADDIFKQLGISKTEGDKKITNSFLNGYLDHYGVRNAKNIATGNRAAIAKDLLAYTNQYISSAAFISSYKSTRDSFKPVKNEIQTPEQMQQNLIADNKKGVASLEQTAKKADPSVKKIFEDALAEARKNLKDAEDPNNKNVASYRKNYPELVKSNEESYKTQLGEWETKYPAGHLQFVKMRLQQFLDETKDIDFNAALTEKNGKKYFVNKLYESKSYRWKMAFRAGKEVVEAARNFVQQWIAEIR